MYYGGRFKLEQTIVYIGDKVAIFRKRNPKELSITLLCKMYMNGGFWYCSPTIDLDGGFLPIRGENDIKLMNTTHDRLPTRVINF